MSRSGDGWSVSATTHITITVTNSKVSMNQTVDLSYTGPNDSGSAWFGGAAALSSLCSIDIYIDAPRSTQLNTTKKLAIDLSQAGPLSFTQQPSNSYNATTVSAIVSGSTTMIWASKPSYVLQNGTRIENQETYTKEETPTVWPSSRSNVSFGGVDYTHSGASLGGSVYLWTPGTTSGETVPNWSGSGRITSSAELVLIPAPLPPTIEFITDDSTSTFVRIGIWDNAYNSSGQLKNGASESNNFVGADSRNFYVQVTHRAANTSPNTVDRIEIKLSVRDTSGARRENRPSEVVTLEETGLDTGMFKSRGLMLVSRDIDAQVETNKGFEDELASWGEKDHRLRLGLLNDIVFATYVPSGSQTPVVKEATVFPRGNNDERRLLTFNAVYYFEWKDKDKDGVYTPKEDLKLHPNKKNDPTSAFTSTLKDQVRVAKELWGPAGLDVRWKTNLTGVPYPEPINKRKVRGVKTESAYKDFLLHPEVPGALSPLVEGVLKTPNVAPPNSLTVIFVPMAVPSNGKPVAGISTVLIKDQFPDYGQGLSQFVFLNTQSINPTTLGHELFHVLYNKLDPLNVEIERQYFTFQSKASTSDVLNYSRIHPHTINWIRKVPQDLLVSGILSMSETGDTGNGLVRAYVPEA